MPHSVCGMVEGVEVVRPTSGASRRGDSPGIDWVARPDFAGDHGQSGTRRVQAWYRTFSIGLVCAWRVRLAGPELSDQRMGNLSCTVAELQGAIAKKKNGWAVGGLGKVLAAITA